MRKEKLQELKRYFEEIKIINSIKKESSGNFIKREAYDFYLNNNRVITREKLIKGKNDGSAVIIIPTTSEDEILTVIEPRVFTSNTLVSFPAGYIEQKEDKENAARRELREETGYVSDKLILLDSFYQDEGCSEAFNYIYLALNCKKKYEQNLDKDEIVKYMLFKYNELLELEKMGYIKSGNAKLALSNLKTYRKGRYL